MVKNDFDFKSKSYQKQCTLLMMDSYDDNTLVSKAYR